MTEGTRGVIGGAKTVALRRPLVLERDVHDVVDEDRDRGGSDGSQRDILHGPSLADHSWAIADAAVAGGASRIADRNHSYGTPGVSPVDDPSLMWRPAGGAATEPLDELTMRALQERMRL